MEITNIRECRKHIPCVDCTDECIHAGKKSADCPYYGCPYEGKVNNDCENCEFIDVFVEQLRIKAETWGKEVTDDDT